MGTMMERINFQRMDKYSLITRLRPGVTVALFETQQVAK
tara:strand:+ start:360 stop:476 length:117 start_codon:yes stop_codon:yes gene_type:complete